MDRAPGALAPAPPALVRRLRARLESGTLSRYFSIGEQITLSATNMLASLTVLRAAGVEQFGIYSFAFAIATFLGAFMQVLLHRQMTLEISSLPPERRRDVFFATTVVQLVALAILMGAVNLVAFAFADALSLRGHAGTVLATTGFVVALNLFDLNRQYLYVTDRQAYSFRCTAAHAVVALAGFAVVLLASPGSMAVAHTYLALAASFLVAMAVNAHGRAARREARWHGWGFAGDVLSGYFRHSRFSLVGLVVTWAQNQSMNPFLMWVGGPLVVGWFNLARLFVMPMTVIGQGLANATIPSLRRAFQKNGPRALGTEIGKLIVWNMTATLGYFALLLACHLLGLFERFVPDYADVRTYLLFWVVTLFVMTLRSWIGQFFEIRMRFRFMLGVSVTAVIVTLGGMAITAALFDDVRYALAFVVVGEIVAIGILAVVARRELATAAPAGDGPGALAEPAR